MNYIEIKVNVLLYKEDEFYIAYSPLFDLCVNSAFFNEARKSIKKVLELVIESWVNKKIVDKKLHELGIVPKDKKVIKEEENRAVVDIPFGEIEKNKYKVENIYHHIPIV